MPPKPSHKHPEPPHKRPKPPHEHPKPPHKHPKPHKPPQGKLAINTLLLALAIGTGTALVVGAALHFWGIGINVVLPATAPIWVGTVTLAYTVLQRK